MRVVGVGGGVVRRGTYAPSRSNDTIGGPPMPDTDDEITVFTAAKIVTMNDSQPTATAVAVRGGKILSVGSLRDLASWLDVHPHRIDRTFEGKVIMPGFIDPHLHPMLGATMLHADVVAAFEWRLPW